MKEHNINVVCLSADEPWRIKKNVVVVTVAFMVHYTAVYSLANLQSSINAEAGLGNLAMMATFVGTLICNIFLTSVFIKWLGTKWTVCCSFIAYMPFVAFQLYPRLAIFVTSGFLMGIGNGMLLCAKSTYISMLAEAYGMISKLPSSEFLLSFTGFFFMVGHMSQIWGNLISSLVLNSASVSLFNETMIPQICGSNFLPNTDAAEALPAQPFEKLLILICIYLTCMAGAALLVAIGLDSMKRYQFCRTDRSSLSGFALLAVTMKQLADTNQQLLLIINIFMGLQQAFIFADFTVSFVSCVIGTGQVGYVMTGYGVSMVAGCFITFCFPKIGRLPLMCGALLIHGGILVMMLTWQPHAEDFWIILAIAILWGICDSIWTTQINTYYAILFRGKEEAAFSNIGLWEGVGYIITYSISSYVRTRYKIVLLLFVLILGFMGYLSVEYRQRRRDIQFQKQEWSKENNTATELAELENLTF